MREASDSASGNAARWRKAPVAGAGLLVGIAASLSSPACFYDFDRSAPLHDAGAASQEGADVRTSPATDGGFPAACSDGVKNGDESGVDCGGSCSPCASRTKPASCREQQTAAPTTTSGVFEIATPGSDAPFSAFCEMTTDGGGWTLIYKSTQTTSVPSTMYAHFFTGDGVSELLGEARTADDEKYVIVDLPSFSELLVKGDAQTSLQVKLTNGNAGDAIRTSWKTFFGPAGKDKDVTGNPQIDVQFQCTDPSKLGVFRTTFTNLYAMQGIGICLPATGDAGADVATFYIGDQGCGVNQCFATNHRFYPTARSTDSASPAFETLSDTNTNVRLYVR